MLMKVVIKNPICVIMDLCMKNLWQVKAFSLSLSLSLILLAFPALAYHGISLSIIGTTSPEALVTVRIPKLALSKPVIADEDGHFIATFNDVPPGVYELAVSAIKNGSANETSQLLGVPDSPAVTQMTISEINLPLILSEPINEEKADLNNDGRVNLVDLSILLFYWGSPIRSGPYSKQADLNGDNSINLKDISLMLSHWTNQ